LWYARPGDETAEEAQRTWRRDGPWFGAVKEECAAVRDHAGILDLPGFSRFRLTGHGAAEWLSRQITGRVPTVGRLGLGYFADEEGRIVTEMSLARLAEDEILLITAAAAELHDYEWLTRHLSPNLTLTNETDAWNTQILTGPKSRLILSEVTDADLTRPWLNFQQAQIADRSVLLMRVSFAGELGWEIHSSVADTPDIRAAVWQAGQIHGLRPFGMFALDSLRIEKGYRAWKGDLSTDYTVVQAGLARFVDWSKPAFRGRDALLAEQNAPRPRNFAVLTIACETYDAPYMASIWQADRIVGELTSSAWGCRLNACIGLGMIDCALNTPGTAVEVEIFGHRYPAVVRGEGCLWDPKNDRIRA
jgi:dimethylglycine dehydrogenase